MPLFSKRFAGERSREQFRNANLQAGILTQFAPNFQANTGAFNQQRRDFGLSSARAQTVQHFDIRQRMFEEANRADETRRKEAREAARFALDVHRGNVAASQAERTLGLREKAFTREGEQFEKTFGLKEAAQKQEQERLTKQDERQGRLDERQEKRDKQADFYNDAALRKYYEPASVETATKLKDPSKLVLLPDKPVAPEQLTPKQRVDIRNETMRDYALSSLAQSGEDKYDDFEEHEIKAEISAIRKDPNRMAEVDALVQDQIGFAEPSRKKAGGLDAKRKKLSGLNDQYDEINAALDKRPGDQKLMAQKSKLEAEIEGMLKDFE